MTFNHAGESNELFFHVKPQPWMADGACQDADPDIFFAGSAFRPTYRSATEPARIICRVCTVRNECLEYALTAGEKWGVWGGLDERERVNLMRRQTRKGAA